MKSLANLELPTTIAILFTVHSAGKNIGAGYHCKDFRNSSHAFTRFSAVARTVLKCKVGIELTKAVLPANEPVALSLLWMSISCCRFVSRLFCKASVSEYIFSKPSIYPEIISRWLAKSFSIWGMVRPSVTPAAIE